MTSSPYQNITSKTLYVKVYPSVISELYLFLALASVVVSVVTAFRTLGSSFPSLSKAINSPMINDSSGNLSRASFISSTTLRISVIGLILLVYPIFSVPVLCKSIQEPSNFLSANHSPS